MTKYQQNTYSTYNDNPIANFKTIILSLDIFWDLVWILLLEDIEELSLLWLFLQYT